MDNIENEVPRVDSAGSTGTSSTFAHAGGSSTDEGIASDEWLHRGPAAVFGDRFVAERTALDLATGFDLLHDTPSARRALFHSGTDRDVAREEALRNYSSVLKSEMFGQEANSLPSETRSTIGGQRLEGQSPQRGLLVFQAPPRSIVPVAIDSPSRAVYSSSPLKIESQQLLLSPKRTPRQIPKLPAKVLDAPELQDDFYLNLVDWSSQNILSVGLRDSVYLWSANTSKVVKLCELDATLGPVTSVGWMPRGTHLAVGTSKGTIQVWDVARSKRIRDLSNHVGRVGCVSWNNYVLSSGSRDRMIFHRDVRVQHERPIATLAGHLQEVCGLKWSPNGQQLASGGNDNKLFIWNEMNTTPAHRFLQHKAAVKALAWSPHSTGLLTSGGGTADRCIRFWNTQSGTSLQSHDTGSQVCNLAWSKTANELVSTHGFSQNQVIVWKYPSMQQLAVLTGHTFRVLYLAMSPDGQTIVTGAGDETLRFWNVFAKSTERNETSTFESLTAQIR